MATINRKGYGQVEPNHLSAQYTGQIYAQLPAMKADHTTPMEQLENGQFLKYDYRNGCADLNGDGEYMLVFNEVKLYDERRQMYKDFAMHASDMTDGQIYPRLLKTNIGDIFTTNTFKSTDDTPVTVSGPDEEITMPELAKGNYLAIDAQGWLTKATTKPASGIVFQVVKVYNLGDMQDAVKIQRIQ